MTTNIRVRQKFMRALRNVLVTGLTAKPMQVYCMKLICNCAPMVIAGYW